MDIVILFIVIAMIALGMMVKIKFIWPILSWKYLITGTIIFIFFTFSVSLVIIHN